MRMSKKLISIIIFIAVILVAIVTCPNKQAHKDAVAEKMNSAIKAILLNDSTNNSKGDLERGFAALGTLIAQKVFEATIESNLQVNNYFIFSTSSLESGEEKNTLSVGFFGHVFTTFDEKDIEENLNEQMKNTP